jgi:hypothetical protein
VPGLKAFEFALRSALEGVSKEKLFLGASDDVPPQYRPLVEKYFKMLSSGKPPK